jgi:hypothetical protein
MLYEPRESINPRAFSLRHVLLEEVKLRRQRAAGEDERARLARLARSLDVSYDAPGHRFVVRGPDGASCDVPLEALRLYEARVDAGAGEWRRDDEILRANRALAARLIDALSCPPPG